MPNPNPSSFLLLLKGGASRVRVSVYSTGMSRLADLEGAGRQGKGWVALALGALELPNGTYYAVAAAGRDNEWSGRSKPGKFTVLK